MPEILDRLFSTLFDDNLPKPTKTNDFQQNTFTAPNPVVCLRNSKSKVDFVGDLAYPNRLSL